MKYYETSFEEYIQSSENLNLHPELNDIYKKLPSDINDLHNLIIYGAPGIGKYTTALNIINKYTHNELKYDKKTTVYTDKQNYNLKMSDIHYEVDISLLGCNSKLLWHEIFSKIVDIISVKKDKTGIILCKNFQLIHSELLDTFYSYIQQHNHSQANIKIVFIIITEQISFLPYQIIETAQTIHTKHPDQKLYQEYYETLPTNINIYNKNKDDFLKYIQYSNQPNQPNQPPVKRKTVFESINANTILNLKELKSFPIIEHSKQEIPPDNFNIICDNIIHEINNIQSIVFTDFRDCLYDILTYNLDVSECLWYVLSYYINNNMLLTTDISDILLQSHSFFKYYNNNYRPIYHLENIFFIIINKLNGYSKSV
uniref:Uncharacterized protein n=1 Tax=viral metagenome TaxID=1070528 RepID=A0A6C0INV9_9ZZZZ